MRTIYDYIEDYYNEFRGVGQDSIVRDGKKEDAFEVAVLDILYKNFLTDLKLCKSNIDEIAKFIVAPPDRGIDIFIPKDVENENYFDVIQVKTGELSESDIRAAFDKMERCIDDYCDKRENVSINCRKILSESPLSSENKDRCTYIVVHCGELESIEGQKDNEIIYTKKYLEQLIKNPYECVELDSIKIPKNSSYMTYEGEDKIESALVCNLNGEELARLNNDYAKSYVVRNILYGFNLRDSLNGKAKETASCISMRETIEKEPEKFWFFNNGVTIITDDYEINTSNSDYDSVILKKFSIVNGAQTTSSLGKIYSDAKRDGKENILRNLKKVNVLTRILKVKGDELKNSIAIFNNTQNPITSRDMVSNNQEQVDLARKLEQEVPHIFMEIRRGTNRPNSIEKRFTHRLTKNETLAQLAFAGFCHQPHNAKDKKSSLFTRDYSQDTYLINEYYSRIFNESYNLSKIGQGVLFKKTNREIDELLFSQQLYIECRKYAKKKLQEKIDRAKEKKLENSEPENVKKCQNEIDQYNNWIEIVNICLYYFIYTYYEFYENFGKKFHNNSYDFNQFYDKKSEYREELIRQSSELFLLKTTVKIIAKTSNKTNIANWIRGEKSQEPFFNQLIEEFSSDSELEEKYIEMMEKFKII